jgi:hypothetical protein
MPGNDEGRQQLEDSGPARMECHGVGCVRILDRDLSGPPGVGEYYEPVIGLDDGRDVLVRVPAYVQQRDSGRDLEPLRVSGGPKVPLIDRPVIVEPSIGEERSIQSVVRVMMGEGHVGDVLRRDAQASQGLKNETGLRHQPGIDDGDDVSISDQPDSRRDAMVWTTQVPLEQDVDLSHRLSIKQ